MRNRHQNAMSFGRVLIVIALMMVAPIVGGHAAVAGGKATVPECVDAGPFDQALGMHDMHKASGAHAETLVMTTPSTLCRHGHDHARHGSIGGCGAIGCATAALMVTSQADEAMSPRSLGAFTPDTIAAHSPDDWLRPPRTA